jgi:hypothetical protein
LDCSGTKRRFLPKLPGNSGLTASADRATLGKRPGHSHSIVSGASKRLKSITFPHRRFDSTVTFTVNLFCLLPIDGDRRRKQLRQLDASHRMTQLITRSVFHKMEY